MTGFPSKNTPIGLANDRNATAEEPSIAKIIAAATLYF